MKQKVKAKVLSQKCLSTGIYDLWIKTNLAREASSGQFIGIYTDDASKLLPRPISICEVSDSKDALRMVYRVTAPSSGTDKLSTLKEGDEISIIGILGTGYANIIKELKNEKVLLLGGGIGIPPMLQTAKELCENNIKPIVIAGYRDSNLFLNQDLAKYGDLKIASEDGSVGTRGNVLNVVDGFDIKADVIMACGPMPMLKAIKKYASDNNIKAYISLEERMACGVGACLGCVCRTKEVDGHSHVKNARICTDGPVFNAEDVDI